MSSSCIVALRNTVITGLQAQPALAGVQVTYGWPGDDLAQRSRVFTNRARAAQAPTSLKAGRTFRDEDGSFDVVVQVLVVAGDAYDADSTAIGLGLVVEEYVADNRTSIVGTVPGLLYMTMSGWELRNLYNDTGALTELTYTIAYRARLT